MFRQHPVTGPAGHSYISSAPRPTAGPPGAPVNLDVVDHLDSTVRELADYTREANPDASPLPEHITDIYSWCVENTQNTPQAVQQRRDTLVFRQSLEHAIAMGRYKVVRPIRCPACRTLGVMWRRELETAVCTNGNCLTQEGLSNRWTLEQLAYDHIARTSEKTVRECAT